MRRLLKFRVWDGIRISTSGLMFNTSTGVLTVPDSYSLSDEKIHEDKLYKVMQSLCVNDKNDKEIFELDIVRDNDGTIGIVVWDKTELKFRLLGIGRSFSSPLMTLEVIGNIFQNQELVFPETLKLVNENYL